MSLGVVVRTLALCLALLWAPAHAQPTSAAKIGYLVSSSYVHPAFADLFFGSGNAAGGAYGSSLVLVIRSAGGDDDRLPGFARELVDARVQIIVAEGSAAALAAKAVTRTIPIVMVISGDPVQLGLVATLARPGGNVTGVTALSLDLVAKRLQLVKEVVPKARRVGVLWNPASPDKKPEWEALRTAADRLGIALQSLELRRAGDLEPRLDDAIKERADALLLLDDSLTLSLATEITTAVEKRRLPTIYGWDRYLTVDKKGLMAYGPSVRDLANRAARYVNQILKGARPADLPVEQPTEFELVINMRAAKALGLAIPASLLLRADRVIE